MSIQGYVSFDFCNKIDAEYAQFEKIIGPAEHDMLIAIEAANDEYEAAEEAAREICNKKIRDATKIYESIYNAAKNRLETKRLEDVK